MTTILTARPLLIDRVRAHIETVYADAPEHLRFGTEQDIKGLSSWDMAFFMIWGEQEFMWEDRTPLTNVIMLLRGQLSGEKAEAAADWFSDRELTLEQDWPRKERERWRKKWLKHQPKEENAND